MQLPRLVMQSQPALINITQHKSTQEIEQPHADLSIEQPKADFNIRTVKGKLTIDQTKAWEEMNLMNILRRTEINAQEGYQGLMEGIERRARQGTELMKIENKGNPIVNQAIENGHDQMKTISLKYIPSPFSVTFSYEPSRVEIDSKMNRPIIHSIANKPIHNYEPGKVEITMKQYEDLQIDVVNLFSEEI